MINEKGLKCKCCEVTILPPRRVFCSIKCKNKWNAKNVYKNIYTFKYRSASPRNFLQGLCKKRVDRRNLTTDFLLEIYNSQKGICKLSGEPMTYLSGEGRISTNISVDRIDNSKGYDEDNIQLVCIQANKMKAELSVEELLIWCKQIINKNEGK